MIFKAALGLAGKAQPAAQCTELKRLPKEGREGWSKETALTVFHQAFTLCHFVFPWHPA